MMPEQIAKKKIFEAERKGSRVLDLTNLGLEMLPVEIGECVNLRELRLWKNRLSTVPPEIGKLKNLEILYLSGNRIEYLPPEIGDLSNLQELYLTGNQLKTIPIELTYLKRLQKLILLSNKLVELPIEFGNLRLTMYDVTRNPLLKPPIEIAQQGLSAIRSYFSSVSKAEELHSLKEAKILIVGEGGVGKTCLSNKILDLKYSLSLDEDTTEGISIKKWKTCFESKDDIINVNIWDFGGQEIYHATHQFLTKRSIYLYVWTARTDDDSSGRFEYWLNAIKLLSDSSPLLIVHNKIDERLKLIDEISIKKRYPNIVGFVNVSIKTGQGIEDLMDRIKNELKHLPHVGDILPKAWVDVRKHLEELPSNYINYSEYKLICEKYGLSSEKAHYLSRYFHDLGVFLHFHDNPVLKITIFLKPQWATNAVYKIIDTKQIQLNKGLFNFDILHTIWSDYPIEKFFGSIRANEAF